LLRRTDDADDDADVCTGEWRLSMPMPVPIEGVATMEVMFSYSMGIQGGYFVWYLYFVLLLFTVGRLVATALIILSLSFSVVIA
jgi:hypothetical protein